MNPLLIQVRATTLLRSKQFVPRGIVNYARDALSFVLQRHGNAKYREAMREVRSSVERVHIPAVIAARVAQSAFFAKNVMRGPVLADAFADQCLAVPVGHSNQVRLALVLHFDALAEMFHQKRASFTRDLRHGRDEVSVVRSHGYPGTRDRFSEKSVHTLRVFCLRPLQLRALFRSREESCQPQRSQRKHRKPMLSGRKSLIDAERRLLRCT